MVAWGSRGSRIGVVVLAGVAVVVSGLVAVPVAVSAPLEADSITSPDPTSTTDDVGSYTSLVLDSAGNPVISYYDATTGDLKVLRCTNADCSGTQTPQTADRTGDVGQFTSLVLDSAGNPVISYWDAGRGDLKVLRCTNADCSGSQTPRVPDFLNDVGRYTSLVLDSAGNPVISYYDGTIDDLKVLRCTNADCSGTQTPQTPDNTGDDVGEFTSLVLDSAGNPVISYYDFTNGALKVLRCTNADCSGTQTPQTADITGDVGQYTSLVLDSAGNPVISYYVAGRGELKVLRCTNADCSGTQTPQTPPDTTGFGVGRYTSLVLDSAGNPVISYYDATIGDLKVLRCTNADCSGTQTPQTPENPRFPDFLNDVGRYTSLVLDSAGNPVISYYDVTNGALKVLHCWDPAGCGGQDQDGDGVAHDIDNCPAVANPDQVNTDQGSAGDACDNDDDDDGVPDNNDNCRVDVNEDQADRDGDGTGDACDSDDDNDGVSDGDDNCRVDVNEDQADHDGDGTGNACDPGFAIPARCAGAAADPAYNLVVGTTGPDDLAGTPGRDVIVGFAGDDTIVALGGDDVVCAGSGRDNVRTGGGNDQVWGQGGADTIRGGGGADIIRGGGGADTIRGGGGADVVLGGRGADTIWGNRGRDILNGGPGRFDALNGGPGTDRCGRGQPTDVSCELPLA